MAIKPKSEAIRASRMEEFGIVKNGLPILESPPI